MPFFAAAPRRALIILLRGDELSLKLFFHEVDRATGLPEKEEKKVVVSCPHRR